MQLQFDSVSEFGEPGLKFKNLFTTYWPAYKAWLKTKGAENTPDLAASQAALKKYMPEMWPTYEKLCECVKADTTAARFLTGFQPPAYISACSQAVLVKDKIQLVRNYDYHPELLEGTVLLTAWNGKKVMGTSDCLIGLVDGMNENGLAISLTFGGRKEVGVGFGIPFILRYVLEFCNTVEEAVKALVRIPSHMSYNVTVVDRSGEFKTVLVSPDRPARVTDAAFTTNHQVEVDWFENATFNKTIERSNYLKELLTNDSLTANELSGAFLKKPLYNTLFKEGFGTLYTGVYHPAEGTMKLAWPKESVSQSFDNFTEGSKLIYFEEWHEAADKPTEDSTAIEPAKQQWAENTTPTPVDVDWQTKYVKPYTTVLENEIDIVKDKQPIAPSEKHVLRGEISWEILADYWTNIGASYWKK